jgi:hypothetical protein
VLVLVVDYFDYEDEEEAEGEESADEPVNQRELSGGHGKDERPDKQFAQTQAALPGGGEPELQFRGAYRDNVTVAEHLILERLVVDGREGARHNCEIKSPALDFKHEVLVPYAVVLKQQMVSRCAPDAKRKMADNRPVARLFSRKDVQLDHYQSRLST